MMDVNTLRIAVTVAGLVLFLALVAWAWSRRRSADFEAAALLPFGDEFDGRSTPSQGAQGLSSPVPDTPTTRSVR